MVDLTLPVGASAALSKPGPRSVQATMHAIHNELVFETLQAHPGSVRGIAVIRSEENNRSIPSEMVQV